MAEKRTGRRLTWIVTPQRDGQKVDTVLRRELGCLLYTSDAADE